MMETPKESVPVKPTKKKSRAKKVLAKGSVADTMVEAIPVKTVRSKKASAKQAAAIPQAPKQERRLLSNAIYQTLFAAGRLVSKTQQLGDIKKIVKWEKISSGAKDVLDSTKQGVSKIGGSLKNAVAGEKISEGALKAWDSTKEGISKAGETLKHAVEAEKVSGKAKTILDSTRKGVSKVGGKLKETVKAEKISAGAKKAWSSTKRGVQKISRSTTEGLVEIGKSFKAGYQDFEPATKDEGAPAPAPVAAKKVLTPAPAKKIIYPSKKNVLPKVSDIPSQITNDDLEKEVDQIVSEIAQI